MRIYVAAPWKHRDIARIAAHTLHEAGHTVIARWLGFQGDSTDPQVLCAEALHDWIDLHQSDCMVLLNLEKSEGKAVEQGLALAWDIPIVAVGLPSNVFHYLPQYRWVPTLTDALALLVPLPGPDGHP